MPDHPRHVLVDQTVALLREGYRFLSNRRERYGSDVYEIRVLGRRAICLAIPLDRIPTRPRSGIVMTLAVPETVPHGTLSRPHRLPR